MNFNFIRDQLKANGAVFRSMLAGFSPEQARWRPAPDKWSMLEVVSHLRDEEREDFRQYLRLILAGPTQTWPQIRPVQWVTERAYNEGDLDRTLDEFINDRNASLRWLEELGEQDWHLTRQREGKLPLSAGDLLASWLAHDYLHIRQIAKIQYQLSAALAAPYSQDYAGPAPTP